jgi:hypothetical protein
MSDTFQSPLERLHSDLQHAREDASKWRRRYEVEAQQRRNETEVADKTIHDLRAELLQLCQLGASVRPVSRSASVNSELATLRQECDQLTEALAQEQQQHAKTRENLINALGEVLQRGKH